MTKPRCDLLPWDCLKVAADGEVDLHTLTRVTRLYWTRKTDHLPPILPRALLLPVATVFGMGADKYAPRDWEHDTRKHSVSHHFAAMMRHAASPEELDPESGLPHNWHVASRYIMLATLLARGVVVDDRPPAQPNSYEEDAIDVVVDEGSGIGVLS